MNARTLAPGRSAPADLKKDANGFDLPIALGLLLASGQVAFDRPGNFPIVGELVRSTLRLNQVHMPDLNIIPPPALHQIARECTAYDRPAASLWKMPRKAFPDGSSSSFASTWIWPSRRCECAWHEYDPFQVVVALFGEMLG